MIKWNKGNKVGSLPLQSSKCVLRNLWPKDGNLEKRKKPPYSTTTSLRQPPQIHFFFFFFFIFYYYCFLNCKNLVLQGNTLIQCFSFFTNKYALYRKNYKRLLFNCSSIVSVAVTQQFYLFIYFFTF